MWILNAVMWSSTPSAVAVHRHGEETHTGERIAVRYLVHADTDFPCGYDPESRPVRSCFSQLVVMWDGSGATCFDRPGDEADLEEGEIANLAPAAKEAYRQRATSDCRSAAAHSVSETLSDRVASQVALSCCLHQADKLTGHGPSFADWNLRSRATSDEVEAHR